jgi:hypothetical protein
MKTPLQIWVKVARDRIKARYGQDWRVLFGQPVQDAIASEAAYTLLLTQIAHAKDMDAVRHVVANARALYEELTDEVTASNARMNAIADRVQP